MVSMNIHPNSEWFSIKFYLMLCILQTYTGLEGWAEKTQYHWSSLLGPCASFLLCSLLLQAAMSCRSHAVSNPNFIFMALKFTSTITIFALSPQIQATILGISLSGCKKERITEISNLAMIHLYFKWRTFRKQKIIEQDKRTPPIPD